MSMRRVGSRERRRFFEAFDFLLAVFFFGLGPDGGVVWFLMFEEVPENAGQFVGHGGDGLGGAQVGHSPEQSVSLGKCGGVSDACRAFCAQGINTLNGLVRDVLVKEKDAVESLILGAGSDFVVTSQAGEEEFDLLAAGKGRGHVRNGIDISPEPIDVCGFSGPGFVLESEDLAQF